MRSRLPTMLLLLAAIATSSPALAQEDPHAPGEVTAAPGPEREREKVSWALAAAGIALVEGLLAGYSALAAVYPEPVGWFQVITSPLACANGSGRNMAALCSMAAAEMAGLGLYNALELKSSSYSRSDRFWRNFGGFHVLFASLAVTDALLGGSKAEPTGERSKAVGVTLSPSGAPLLVVAGRF